jgi:hypothetical protein
MRLCLIAMGAPLIYGDYSSEQQCDPTGAIVNLASVVAPPGWPSSTNVYSAPAYCTSTDDGSVSNDWYWNAGTQHTCYHWPGEVTGKKCPCTTTKGSNQNCNCVMKNHEDLGWCFTITNQCEICPAGKYKNGCGCDKLTENGKESCNAGTCMPTPIGFFSNGFTLNPSPCPEVSVCLSVGRAIGGVPFV